MPGGPEPRVARLPIRRPELLGEARARAYAALAGLRCAGAFWRRDIGWRALAR